jgi:hypothetical protein
LLLKSSAERSQNEAAALEQSWKKIRLSQNHRFFDAIDSFQLWKVTIVFLMGAIGAKDGVGPIYQWQV